MGSKGAKICVGEIITVVLKRSDSGSILCRSDRFRIDRAVMIYQTSAAMTCMLLFFQGTGGGGVGWGLMGPERPAGPVEPVFQSRSGETQRGQQNILLGLFARKTWHGFCCSFASFGILC